MNFLFTKLPKKLSIDLCRSNLTSREIRVLLFVIEKTLGWQKMEARLRQIDISEATNIHSSHISKTIKSLASKGYLSVKKEKYGLSLGVADKWLEEASVCHKTKPNYTSQIAKLDNPTYPSQPSQLSYVENPQTPTLEPKVAFSKETKKESIKESLLIENQTIKGYFENISAPGKRKREREAYLSLLREGINESDIAKALKFLLTRGIPGQKKTPHLPFCWLLVGIDDLLPHLKKKNTQRLLSDHLPQREPQKEFPMVDEFQQAQQAFERKFSSSKDRNRILSEIIEEFRQENENKFGAGFKFSRHLSERLGLIAWHKKQTIQPMPVAC